MSTNSRTKAESKRMPRTFDRIRQDQLDFIKSESKRIKVNGKRKFSEAEVHRQLLDEGITSRKKKSNAN